MYNSFEQWLNTTLENDTTEDTIALVFNLYQDEEDKWSIELVGTDSFDQEDEDWACDEVFCNRDNPFIWTETAQWEDILLEVENMLNNYLANGKHSSSIKQYQGIAFGFVDGDLNILYTKINA